ncbi:MAG: fatty acyl-AMP ligase, partial [Waterburya sp.]
MKLKITDNNKENNVTVITEEWLVKKSQFKTIVELLSWRAKSQPEKTAYTYLRHGETESGQLTYKELDRRARAIAIKLQQRHIPGSRALLLYPPGLEFIVGLFGCWYAGIVPVPAYPPRRNQNLLRLQAIVHNAQASVVLTTKTLVTNLQKRITDYHDLAEIPWLPTNDIFYSSELDWYPPFIDGDRLALLQYTSGSTGTPKGVMISHSNLWHNLNAIYQGFGHSQDSQGVIWLPPYHDMGLIGGVLQPLYGGFEVTLMAPVDFLQKPWRWLQAISRYRATTSGGPNFAYELCVRKVTEAQLASLDLSSWEVAFTGAEPINAATLDQFADTFAPCGFRREAFYPCYGMAETTLMISGGVKTDPPVLRTIKADSLKQHQIIESQKATEELRVVVGCGQSLKDQTVIVVDPETKIRCDSEKVGEIWVAGPSVAQGYWQRPQETEQAFKAYLTDTEEGPFLRTGDLGFISEGELYVTGRIKDAIIIRGQNHYPTDIERTVETSHPALRLGCGAAFGVEVKGRERLVVVQEVERSYLRRLNTPEVVGQIRQQVASQHGLEIYAAVLVKTGSIPKTSSGKIRRYACRDDFLKGNLNVVSDWSENPHGKSEFVQLWTKTESLLE